MVRWVGTEREGGKVGMEGRYIYELSQCIGLLSFSFPIQ